MEGFVEKTIGRLIQETADRFPENPALIYPDLRPSQHLQDAGLKFSPEPGIRQNYREFYGSCRDVAKGLMALGIKKGDSVSVWTTNVPEWIYLQFSLGMIGGVLVTINTNYQSHELGYILKQSDTTALFLMESHRDINFYHLVRTVIPELDSCLPGQLIAKKFPRLKNVIYIGERRDVPGMFRFDELIAAGKGVPEEDLDKRVDSLDFHDVINMQFTSGTTGFPKGVMLTHYNIVNNGRMVGDVMGLTERDKLLIQVPLFHCFGCVMSTLNCVCHGSAMVVLEFFDPLRALRAISTEKCTAVNGVPTMFIAILNHPEFDHYDMGSLRTGIMAGAPCPVGTMNLVRTKMHCPEIVIAFGQTESSPVMTMTRRDDPVELRVSTVGRLLPGIEGRIVDPVTGVCLPLIPRVRSLLVVRVSWRAITKCLRRRLP